MPRSLDDRVSYHFTLREVIASQTATRIGYDNMIPDALIPNAAAVAVHVLEPLRAQFGAFSPASWYRSPVVNRAVGGKTNPPSQHTTGRAVDIVIPNTDNLRVAEWIKDNLVFDQLILEFYHDHDPRSGWVHVSFVDPTVPAADGAHNRGIVMRTHNGLNYQSGLL